MLELWMYQAFCDLSPDTLITASYFASPAPRNAKGPYSPETVSSNPELKIWSASSPTFEIRHDGIWSCSKAKSQLTESRNTFSRVEVVKPASVARHAGYFFASY